MDELEEEEEEEEEELEEIALDEYTTERQVKRGGKSMCTIIYFCVRQSPHISSND